MLHFITSNQGKLREMRRLLPDVQLDAVDIDLPELQEIDARKVVEFKLETAFKHHAGPFIIEDTSLHMDALGGMPGPLIKWFIQSIGNDGLYTLADRMGSTGAQARTIIGYAVSRGDIRFYEGVTIGNVVSPRGLHGFGWDTIFQPQGSLKTYAEMELTEKIRYSARGKAATALKAIL